MLTPEPGEDHGVVAIIGGGPAGLTAADRLLELGRPAVVFEQGTRVGGLAQTVEYKGFRFDIGGHRFFTKVSVIQQLWREVLGSEFLLRPRLSRIYYRGRFFDYPLKPLNVLRNLGFVTSVAVVCSYLKSVLAPVRPEKSFADWVSNRFGRRLLNMFFATYTEKVWGIPCTSIGAQWAAQRIKGLSLRTAVANMLLPQRKGTQIKTLIDEFEYPRLGPGQMWEAFQTRIALRGGSVELETTVTTIEHDGARVSAIVVERAGTSTAHAPSHVISTMPMRHLVRALSPPAPPEIIAAADKLRYRDFLTVALIVDQRDVFPDNWIYVHDDTVKVGRIQNFKNWSPDMVPDSSRTCLGLEYFCFEGDGLWTMTDDELVALATDELAGMGMVPRERVLDGCVVRMPKAYPVYDETYATSVETVRAYLARFENLYLVGRNGMHKYNNQDHSMLTAMLAVRNIAGERHDLWSVNVDEEYHEIARSDSTLAREIRAMAKTQPRVPIAVPELKPRSSSVRSTVAQAPL
jgi:protoporphyrinogen oxidase